MLAQISNVSCVDPKAWEGPRQGTWCLNIAVQVMLKVGVNCHPAFLSIWSATGTNIVIVLSAVRMHRAHDERCSWRLEWEKKNTYLPYRSNAPPDRRQIQHEATWSRWCGTYLVFMQCSLECDGWVSWRLLFYVPGGTYLLIPISISNAMTMATQPSKLLVPLLYIWLAGHGQLRKIEAFCNIETRMLTFITPKCWSHLPSSLI